MDQSIKRLGNSLIFFKTINLKAMKTIRNQVNYPKRYTITNASIEGH